MTAATLDAHRPCRCLGQGLRRRSRDRRPSAASARSNLQLRHAGLRSRSACATKSSATARCRRCSSPVASPRTGTSPRASAFAEAGWWQAQVGVGPRTRSAPALRCSRSTGSAPMAASTRRSIRPTRPTRSPRCSTCSASIACRRSSAVRTVRWSACSSPRATVHGCGNWSRSAACTARIRTPAPGARCSAAPSRWARCNATKPTAWRWRASWRS